MKKQTKVFGEVEQAALMQLENCMKDDRAIAGAIMADGHLGYSMPVGGVVAYKDAISVTGVGFDIGCGNMAVCTNWNINDMGDQTALIIKPIMREIQRRVSFGLGRSNNSPQADDPVLDRNSTWREIDKYFGTALYAKAVDQLGTVGSGNHYVDLLADEGGFVWIANHFGSRGLGHTIASGFMAKVAGRDFIDRVPESESPVVLDVNSDLGEFYIAAMHLAGKYAYAGREYVTQQVLDILGIAKVVETVHNHHNFAWKENGLWVVRKGATPLTHEPAYIGGSMGEGAVIVRGRTEAEEFRKTHPFALPSPLDYWKMQKVIEIGAIGSAPHGSGRIMSRTQAAGKLRKMWVCPNHNCDFEPIRCSSGASGFPNNHCPKCFIPLRRVRMRDASTASINWDEERSKLNERGIVVLGAGADESPGVYKRLHDVITSHPNIEVMHQLRPLGVVMAGSDVFDPFKD